MSFINSYRKTFNMETLISALIAFACTSWIYPYILKVAKVKNIVDNPDARKLQRVPIPVLGGLTIAFGILIGLMTLYLFDKSANSFPIMAPLIIILIIGLIDDVISLSPRIRFIVEIALVLHIIKATGCQINDFGGLWGIHQIPDIISIPLTVLACVGLINAINLIDGVDGYSSGYSIVSSLLFALMFYAMGNIPMMAFAIVVSASLLTFFFHNVFGKRTKMFIGDAGTLSLGIVFTTFGMSLLSANQSVGELPANLGLVPFTLAVLSVPLFDTVRVMSARMVRGKSPFHPDKTHLHHLFIELGFSHVGTSFTIIGSNLIVVLCWFIAYRCDATIDIQLYIVVALSIFITFIFYPFMKRQIRQNGSLYRFFNKFGQITHVENKPLWRNIQQWIDKTTID